jgi:hypothetical protein
MVRLPAAIGHRYRASNSRPGSKLPTEPSSGVMGMNFQVPLFEDPNNFWVVVAGMAVIAVVVLMAARIRGWL